MFGYRQSAVSRLKTLAIALTFVLAPAFAAQAANSCDDARKVLDQIDPNLQKAIAMMTRIVFNADPAETQKALCEQSKLWAEVEKESVRRHESVDQACGARIRWEKCDTACARKELRKKEKEAAYQCDPARVTEAVRNAQQEKEKFESDIRNTDACTHVVLALDKEEASNPEWPAWIRACNGADRHSCTQAWFTLERIHLSTKELTCRPNAEERAENKRIEKEVNSLMQKR